MNAFLADIEAYLKSSGLDPTAFGKHALGDPSFVFDLRKGRSPSSRTMEKVRAAMTATPAKTLAAKTMTHLDKLEAESIHIIREVAAECEKPVMLYSIGKDSAVMLHLAMKAFYPSKPPFPLMHVDTRYKFRDMIKLRDETAKKLGLDLIVHINPEGVAKDINPFDHGSQLHTHIMKTEGLKQALDKYGFDAAFGGAPITPARTRASRSVCSRCRTGLSLISGNIFTARISKSCRCILPMNAPWWNVMAS
jgi:sulfate adenylyltransferase subunit 2